MATKNDSRADLFVSVQYLRRCAELEAALAVVRSRVGALDASPQRDRARKLIDDWHAALYGSWSPARAMRMRFLEALEHIVRTENESYRLQGRRPNWTNEKGEEVIGSSYAMLDLLYHLEQVEPEATKSLTNVDAEAALDVWRRSKTDQSATKWPVLIEVMRRAGLCETLFKETTLRSDWQKWKDMKARVAALHEPVPPDKTHLRIGAPIPLSVAVEPSPAPPGSRRRVRSKASRKTAKRR